MPEENKPEKKKFKPTKRFIIGAVVLTLVVVLIVVAAILLSNKDRRPNYGLYVKNGALYYTDFKGNSFRVTSNLTATDGSLPDVDYDLRYCATLSDNGKYLFFPENMTISGEDVQTFDLCFQKVANQEETVCISKNVIRYHISSDAMTVTYLTTDGLYQYELKPASSNLLCKNVYDFQVADNTGRLVYLTAEGELYAQNPGSSKTKIDNHVDEILYVAGDFRSVIYRQENSIHKWMTGKGETEICADAINWFVYPSGKALFLSNAEGYSQLYYHQGQNTVLVLEHVDELVMTAKDAPVAVLTKWELIEPEDETTEVPEPRLQTVMVSEKDIYVLEDVDDKTCVGMDGSGKNIYFVDTDAETSTMYQLTMGTFGLDELQIYDTDVYTQNITITGDNRAIYFKNADAETGLGTLYLNTAELATDVTMVIDHFQAYGELPDGEQIYYFTGYNTEKHFGILHVASTDGSNRQISGAAILPFMLHNGQILFMENYNEATGGDLYAYIDGNTILIDSGVTFYIPVL